MEGTQYLREKLRERLDNIGKKDTTITKTLLWHWITEHIAIAHRVALLNNEMNKADFANRALKVIKGVSDQELSPEEQADIVAKIRLSSVSINNILYHNGMPESYFYADPPLQDYSRSNRILITGEPSRLYHLLINESLNPLELSQEFKISKDLAIRLKKAKKEDISLSLRRISSFWESFFNEDNFLDKPVSVPELMISTGFMRNYNYIGGETLNVGPRLREIAQRYQIDFELIPSFCI